MTLERLEQLLGKVTVNGSTSMRMSCPLDVLKEITTYVNYHILPGAGLKHTCQNDCIAAIKMCRERIAKGLV
jgi:hypothetical protein